MSSGAWHNHSKLFNSRIMNNLWSAIAEHIWQVTGQKLINPSPQSVGGGSINQAYLLSDRLSTDNFFVKINMSVRVGMFEAEAIALEQIFNTQTIRVPKPICWGTSDNSAYIVMEWIEFGKHKNWQELGKQLAAMHRISNSLGFGWQQQNTIGSTPQINTWTDGWLEFFMEHRLVYQLKLSKQRGFSPNISEDRLIESVPKFFKNYSPIASMVHGDLWSGNVDFSQTGEPVIYDPALYFGDREVDLAMTELFGRFPSAFYQSYDQAFPIDSGYKLRQPLYNLYHILNHFNLFGGSYGLQANRMIEAIIG
jgi:fructosamine-3-kinase